MHEQWTNSKTTVTYNIWNKHLDSKILISPHTPWTWFCIGWFRNFPPYPRRTCLTNQHQQSLATPKHVQIQNNNMSMVQENLEVIEWASNLIFYFWSLGLSNCLLIVLLGILLSYWTNIYNQSHIKMSGLKGKCFSQRSHPNLLW